MDIEEKLNEAKFFLELFDTLEKRSDSLTNNFSIEAEASYILSAILNSFYSVTELAGGKQNPKVKSFRYKEHPSIYAGSGKGGLRNTTVHVRHISADHLGYIPPKGDSINFNMKRTAKLVEEQQNNKAGIAFNIGPYFYLKIGGKYQRITELLESHFKELKTFINNDM